jgi:NAD(P)-dependent dehydrogenase (short-subunit alcohol dehydrogenase family)
MNTLYPSVDVHVRSFDAADEKALTAVIDEAISQYGRLDIFFANAGIVGQPKLFTEVAGNEFLETMRVNALG